MPDRLVVVGASLAGLRACEAARKAGFEGEVVLVGAEQHLPYDRPPLSKEFLAPASEAAATTLRTAEDLAEKGVELRLGVRATALTPSTDADRPGGTVTLEDGSGSSEELAYDALVVATGAHVRTLPDVPELAGLHYLRTLDDARAIEAALVDGARVVVIGAGFIGSEIASAGVKRGLDVTVVEADETPLRRAVGEQMGVRLAAVHDDAGTRLLRATTVARVLADADGKRVAGVELADGTTLAADLVVVGIGAAPTTDWLDGSGIELDPRDGGVVCDEHLATSVPGVYAAGDVAAWHNPLLGERQRLEHWTSAAEQGGAAGRNAVAAMSGQEGTAYATVPYFWSDWYDHRIQMVGWPRGEEVALFVDTEHPARWTALYREGDRLRGALTLNGQGVIMKFRARLMKGGDWQDAVAFAEQKTGPQVGLDQAREDR
ncbi:FAD-dependent oxidoreductase [Nocardioidaceae bacterium]|nr:FAD-dependent oxidoreductase [Nocardioidaceae bacterium]